MLQSDGRLGLDSIPMDPFPAISSVGAQPLVTVVTPCLNADATIHDTLTSVAAAREELRCRGHHLEHLILDGGSQDDTAALVAHHIENHPFCRRIDGVGGGPYAAMNRGLALARGLYTHILNSDDLLTEPEIYATFLIEARQQGALVLLASICYFRRPERWITSHWGVEPLPNDPLLWREKLLQGLHYPHPGFVAETSLYRDQGFDERYDLSADYKLMQSLLLRPWISGSVLICPQPLVAMAEGGVTGDGMAILRGWRQLRAINRELGIQAPAWRRYLFKLKQRLWPPPAPMALPGYGLSQGCGR